MNDNNNNRRDFIKQLTFFSLLLGLNPTKVISANNIELNEAIISDINDIQGKYREGVKALYNVKVAQSLNENDLKLQYAKAIKLAGKSSVDPSAFRNGNVSNLINENKITKKDYDAIYSKKYSKIMDGMDKAEEITSILVKPLRELYPVLDDTLNGLEFGYQLGKTGVYGTICASTIATKKIPLTLPACYEFFTSAISTYNQFQQIGNNERNNRNLKSASQSAVNLLGANIYNQFKDAPNYKFDVSNNFAFKLDNSSVNLQSIVGQHSSPSEERLNQILFKQNTSDTSFKLERMNDFFEGVVSELGNIQQDFLKTKLETAERQREDELINQREKALLYSSLGQLVGIFAEQAMGPKEAALFNALMPLAIEFALAGAIGPMGWAAIGVTVASTLFGSRSESNPNAAIFKSLAQIQKQLDVINQNIEQVYETQLVVLDGLNRILSEQLSQRELLEERFETINNYLGRIYKRVETGEITTINNNYQKIIKVIRQIVIHKDTSNSPGTLVTNLKELVNIATINLDDPVFTKYDEGKDIFNGSELKNEIFPERFISKISLYDSIGLISGLANYSANSDKTKNQLALLQPVLFYKICGEIIDWLVMSNIENNTKRLLSTDLLKKANESKQHINTCCNNKVIEERSNNYLNALNDALNSFRKELIKKHKDDFESEDNTKKHIKLNSVGKNYNYGNESVFNFNPEQIKDSSDNYKNFLEKNEFDDLLLTLAVDNKLIAKISKLPGSTDKVEVRRTLSKRDYERENKKWDLKIGDVIGSKINRIKLDSLLIKYDKRNPISLPSSITFDYQINIIATKVDEKVDKCGVGNGIWVCRHVFNVSETSVSNGVKDIKWQESVKTSLKSINIDLASILPNFEKMNFHDFLNHLLDQHFLKIKQDYINAGIEQLKNSHHSKIDGSGVSLMVLTKLNQVVTANSLIPYEIDYDEEIFTKNDFEEALNFYSSLNLVNPKKESNMSSDRFIPIYQKIISEHRNLSAPYNYPDNKLENAFFLNDDEKPLDPSSFIDLMCILMKRRVIKTVENCRLKTKELKENDCEPYLADTINTLNWFNNIYLNAT